jgi:hypothetical protein
MKQAIPILYSKGVYRKISYIGFESSREFFHFSFVPKEAGFCLGKVMLTESNLVVTNIHSSIKWHLLQNLIQPGPKTVPWSISAV